MSGHTEVRVGKKVILRLKNNNKRVKWSVTAGKKNIRLSAKKKKSVVIKGVKKGSAKVQAKIGKKKYICKVTVLAAKKVTATPAVSVTPSATPAASTKPSSAPKSSPAAPASNGGLSTAKPGNPDGPVYTLYPDDPVPTDPVPTKNEQDLAALKQLVEQQTSLGALVNADPDSSQYEWSEGRLTGIDWNYSELCGTLDLSGLPALKSIGLSNNNLTSVNTSANTEAEYLNVSSNQLSQIDVTGNVSLKTLDCGYNLISKLDLSKNVKLDYLDCTMNKISQVDVTMLPELLQINCDYNLISGIDVSQNPELDTLYCYACSITSLDLSQNKMLRILDCSENQLTSLDVSYNTALSSLKCSVNAITSLDLSNNPLLNEENVSAGKDVSIIYAK